MISLRATIISLFFASAIGVFADLQIYTPSPAPTQCAPVTLQWSGGAPPYFLAIIGSGDGAVAIQQYDGLFDTSFLWSTNITGGTSVEFTLTDITGTLAQSDLFVVQTSSDSTCLESSVPTQTLPVGVNAGASAGASAGAGATAVATAGVSEGSGGVSVGASAGAGGGTAGATAVATAGINEGFPESSSTGSSSTTLSTGSASVGSSSRGSMGTDAPAVSTTSPTSDSSPLPLTSTTSDTLSPGTRRTLPMGTIMGIVIGALIVLLTMIALLVWKRRQAIRSTPHPESAPADAAADLMKSTTRTTQLVAQPNRLKPLPAAPEYALNAADLPSRRLHAVPPDSQSQPSDSDATIHAISEVGQPATSDPLLDTDARRPPTEERPSADEVVLRARVQSQKAKLHESKRRTAVSAWLGGDRREPMRTV
ncbi:hypothetical protein TRAPUB_4010 [Trametes pubescens]|uniref:Mid2 domain-containing protein n=1 Tax=Trametes pubescens TaxID=154538 RepID=A0A1M2VCA6_TRAPU|nr:hypothetical protein TRAPUB_4010 [Trametes pubescens]